MVKLVLLNAEIGTNFHWEQEGKMLNCEATSDFLAYVSSQQKQGFIVISIILNVKEVSNFFDFTYSFYIDFYTQ